MDFDVIIMNDGAIMKNNKIYVFFSLHILLAVYSLSGICGKLAAAFEVLSPGFVLCYGGLLFIFGIYAICWQQIIKRLSLTVAFANKAITVVWGIIWGYLFFDEAITLKKLIGAALVMTGIVLYAKTGDDLDRDEGGVEQ